MIAKVQKLTVEEYLAMELESEIKHEYIDGELLPMPDASGPHNSIVANAIIALGNALAGRGCTMFASQMRIQIDETRYLYPDASVVCGDPAYADENQVNLLNPTVVVEVTSPSSMTRDRVRKLELYATAPSIQGYLILDQERVHAEWHRRTESGWRTRQYSDLNDEIALEPLGCQLRLAAVYRGLNR